MAGNEVDASGEMLYTLLECTAGAFQPRGARSFSCSHVSVWVSSGGPSFGGGPPFLLPEMSTVPICLMFAALSLHAALHYVGWESAAWSTAGVLWLACAVIECRKRRAPQV